MAPDETGVRSLGDGGDRPLDIARQHDRREDAEALVLRVATQLASDVVQTMRRNVSESARPGPVDRDASVAAEPGSFSTQ